LNIIKRSKGVNKKEKQKMSLIVEKFGGTSVANAQCVSNVAKIIKKTREQGHDVIVIVSAQGKTTDNLIKKANEINPNASKREIDVLLSAGEQISMALLAIALEKNDVKAVSLTGWQAGFKTCKSHGNARIEGIFPERIQEELLQKKVVIIAGFQGISENGDITTMGRGGSDTSAVALAAALKADECRIYTDVEGVYTANPRVVPKAKFLEIVPYDDMIQFAALGAKVLNKRSVKIAKKYGVEISVLSSFKNSISENIDQTKTIVKEISADYNRTIKGVISDHDIAIISLQNHKKIDKIFEYFAKSKIAITHVFYYEKKICLIVNESDLNTINKVFENLFSGDENNNISVKTNFKIEENVSKISVVGSGKETHMETAEKILEILKNFEVKLVLIDESVSVIIPKKDSELAVRLIHDKFFD
jgi:aspartate kinase